MEKNDLTLEQLKEIVKEEKEEVLSFRSKKKLMHPNRLKKHNIHFKLLNNNIIIVPLKQGMAINYGASPLGERDYFFDENFKLISNDDLEIINAIDKENRKEREILDAIYESQKIRGLFEKMKNK